MRLGPRLPPALGAVVVGAFALFHGYVHGVEMGATVGGFEYGAGFACATALLYTASIGVAVGFDALRRSDSRVPAWPTRALGWSTAGIGVVMAFV